MTSEPPRHVHRRRRNRPRKHHAMEPLPPEALTASRRKKPHNLIPAPSPDPPGIGEDDTTADDSSGLMGSSEVTVGNSTALGPARGAGAPLVRAEEAMIVCLVLLLWVGAIALFFNRWGKIRMLEPYQPKFQPAHRPSCPLLELPQTAATASPPSCPLNQRLQFNKFNTSQDSGQSVPCPHGHTPARPRQNSVFVATPCMAAHFAPPPRKAKSAVDLQELFLEQEEMHHHMPRPCYRGRRASSLLPPLLPTVPDDLPTLTDVPLTVEPPTPTPDSLPCQVLVLASPCRPSPALLRVTHV
ncbi:uncharacterized protein LOC132196685 [Neocloeon triangulifer]|uniref:uncharacterized protein LOC132196685 n=1 Tax=Neocloeon triangulifer TaxID=2078957 RepID=UPI00286F00FE|nr:uncharacterized protein LOC132196685 [Neocloeon triangulifer]